MTMTKMTCGCGRVFKGIPANAYEFDSGDEIFTGTYFDCPCGSTHFIPRRRSKSTAVLALALSLIGVGCQSAGDATSPGDMAATVEEVSIPVVEPSATPEPSASPTPESTPSASPSPEPSPSPTPSPSPSPSPSPTPYAFGGGNGTQSNPYELETATDVQNIGQAPSAYFTVVQDINMSGASFQPIASFAGTIYGNNKQLYNLAIATTGSTTAALFQSVTSTATIVQLKLVNVTISSQSGYATGFAGTLRGFISNCSISGTITSPLGGNGFNTGTGNSVYVTKPSPGSVVNTTQNVQFNGNTVNATLNQ